MHSSHFVFGLAAAACLHAAPVTLNDPYLAGIRAEAARTHPELSAKLAEAAAARAATGTIRLWEDPMLGIAAKAASRDMRREEGDLRISLDQPLPRPALTHAKRQQAAEEALAKQEIVRQSAASRSADAALAAIELALQDESIAITGSQLRWLDLMLRNARQRATNPNTPATEALRLETEQLRMSQMQEAERRTRNSMAAQLNLLLGRPTTTPWPELVLPELPAPSPVGAAEAARIDHLNPELRSMQHMASAADAAVDAAIADSAPVFSLGIESNAYSGGGVRDTMLGIRMNLPWLHQDTYQAAIREASARKSAAQHTIDATRLEIRARTLDAANRATNAAILAARMAGPIRNQAQLAARSTESAWLSSSATLADVLDAHRTLDEITLEQRKAVAAQLAALETLRALAPQP